MKPIAYEGKEPYIFISYAHKDSDRVFQVLDELDKKGYRIWYDDGIAPGSEWPEDIARHLDAAHMVIAFVTANSMASINCRREINFALSKEKHFLSILLERTEMPLGMEMQLSAQQSILRYNYSTWEGFIDKILKCPDIVPCQRPQPAPVTPVQMAYQAPVQSMPTQSAPQQPIYQGSAQPAQQAPVQMPAQQVYQAPPQGPVQPVPQAPVQPVPQTLAQPVPQPAVTAPQNIKPASVKKVKTPKAKPAPGTASSNKIKVILFSAIGVVCVACIVLAIVLFSGQHYKTSWGSKISRNDQYLVFSGYKIEQEDLKYISKMKKITSLTLINCDFSSCDFSSAPLPKTINKLDLENATGIKDYSFLNTLACKELNINGASSFAALGSLDLSNIERLFLNNTSVESLEPLKDAAALTELHVSGTKISDLSVVSSFSKLIKIDASNTNITSLVPLAGLTELTDINVSYCSLSELPDELLCLKLTSFIATSCGLKDLDLLKNCTKLSTLVVSKNPDLTSIETVIDQNKETLQIINIALTGLDSSQLEILRNCLKLKTLVISGLSLKNLDFCRSLAGLQQLRADGCGLTDISGLKNCTALKFIILGFNELTDISALSGITAENTTKIDLSFNQISDVSSLPSGKYRFLLLHGNDPSVTDTIRQDCSFSMLTCDYQEGITSGPLSQYKENFYAIYVTDTPTNQILALEESIGKSTINLFSMDELMETLLSDSLIYSIEFDYEYPYSLYKAMQ